MGDGVLSVIVAVVLPPVALGSSAIPEIMYLPPPGGGCGGAKIAFVNESPETPLTVGTVPCAHPQYASSAGWLAVRVLVTAQD